MADTPRPAMINVVFWDIDGTLAETEKLHDQKYRAVASSFIGRPVHDDEWFYTIGLPEPKMFELLQKKFPEVNDFARFHEEAKDYYMAHAGEIKPRPGIPEALAMLAGAKVPMAAASGSRGYAAVRTLDAIGIHPDPATDFKFVLSLDDLDGHSGKPDPYCYLKARKKMAELLGVDEGRINPIAIEDSPTGAEAAKAAGFTLIFRPVDPKVTFPAADVTVSSDADFLAALKRLACPAAAPTIKSPAPRPFFP
jgi:beta-phosphoglucomutase-like phosphatase (HAD superfamily)